jgi:hypothetical protein
MDYWRVTYGLQEFSILSSDNILETARTPKTTENDQKTANKRTVNGPKKGQHQVTKSHNGKGSKVGKRAKKGPKIPKKEPKKRVFSFFQGFSGLKVLPGRAVRFGCA